RDRRRDIWPLPWFPSAASIRVQSASASRGMTNVDRPVLDVNDLKVYYQTPRGPVKAVDGVSFELQAEERFGLVGESGSGKTTIALALVRMIRPRGRNA